MGAYTPLPWAPAGLVDEVLATVLQPTVDEMARRGTPFSGLLYAGLALTSRGVRVIEFNARFGDPETQPLLALLESPLGELLMAAATGDLAVGAAAGLRDGAAVAVVMASRGYPASSSSGDVITGVDAPRRSTACTSSTPARRCRDGDAGHRGRPGARRGRHRRRTSRPPAPRRTPASRRSPSTAPSTAPTSQRRTGELHRVRR